MNKSNVHNGWQSHIWIESLTFSCHLILIVFFPENETLYHVILHIK